MVLDRRTVERRLAELDRVLAHEYLDIDLEEVIRWRSRILEILPAWIGEVAAWMDQLNPADDHG